MMGFYDLMIALNLMFAEVVAQIDEVRDDAEHISFWTWWDE